MALTIEDRLSALERENVEIKHRVATVEGQFAYISGQLRDVQLYMHAKFGEIDKRFDRVEQRLDKVEQRLDKVEKRLDKIEVRLDKIEVRLGVVETKLDGLIETLPGIMRDVMREVLAEKRPGV